MTLGEPLRVTLILAELFDELGVRYFVGGSVASSIHGIPRATLDADLVADLQLEQVAAFAAALKEDFYLDEDAIRRAIERRQSFNVIQLRTMFKVDIFISKSDGRSQEEMARRERYRLPDSERELFVASAEDTILEKLRWYELGNRVSDRQWQDVQGILRVKRDSLDRDYLKSRAEQANLLDLLSTALTQAGENLP